MSNLLLVLTLLTGAPGELPIDPDQRIEPIVTRDAYMDCCRELGVVDDQIPIAELLYEDYLTGLMELQASSIERAKAAGSDELEAAFQGQSSLRSDELRALRIAVMRTRALNWSEVDALQQMLIEGTVAIGVDGTDVDIQLTLQSMQRPLVQGSPSLGPLSHQQCGGFPIPVDVGDATLDRCSTLQRAVHKHQLSGLRSPGVDD